MLKNKFRFIFFTCIWLIGVNAFGQSADRIAFISSDEVLEVMPTFGKAKDEVKELNQRYKDELQLMQNEYNKKYSDFISYQTSMAENIRLRRMQELYELEQQINNFMQVAQKDILEREEELLKPMRTAIKEAIYMIGLEGNFICIYDLSNPSILFVTPDAIDITALVKAKVGVR